MKAFKIFSLTFFFSFCIVICWAQDANFIVSGDMHYDKLEDIRTKILTEEKKHILKFSKADLPGYAVISISGPEGDVVLNYYNGLSEKPFETVNLTKLQQLNKN
ncbi:MAG: metallophosphoesterase [Chitinophagaceae bacterium]|nr:metallophosphoesterase [Chitinophagaceae bacterium]